MGFCGECGFKYGADAGRFCPECGNKLPQAEAAEVAEVAEVVQEVQQVVQEEVVEVKAAPSKKVVKGLSDKKALKAAVGEQCGPEAENGSWIALELDRKGNFVVAGTGETVCEIFFSFTFFNYIINFMIYNVF